MSDELKGTPPGASEREEQLESLIADYIRGMEAGRAPQRQELLKQYPEFASELKQFFGQRDRMNRLVDPIREFGDDLYQSIGPGKQLSYVGNYELLEEVARGGMGVVYKARQTTLNRVVAVKMIVAGRLAKEQDVQRFKSEAQAAASLKHQNIVPIHEVGQHEGWHYFSMDHIEGHDLATVLRQNVLPAGTAASYVCQMAEAIHYAHQHGILHRDLKPSNILVDPQNQIHITDFGLATRVDADQGLTQTGQILGTPSYMPPEQAQGKRGLIGPGSDVYALGAILYECRTGRPPFRAESVIKTIEQVIHAEAALPQTLNASVPRDLQTICLKCLEKEPHRRYGTAQLLAEDLERFLKGEPILARPIGRSARVLRWCWRNPTVASLCVAVTFALVVGSAVAGYFAVEANQRAMAEKSERNRAVLREKEAIQLRNEANEQRKLAEEQGQLAIQQAENLKASNEQLSTLSASLEQQAKQLRERQVALYRSLLKLAHSQTQGNLLALADENLSKFPEEFRGWAWRYAKRLCHPEFLTLKGSKHVSVDPTGRILATTKGEIITLYELPSGAHKCDLMGHTKPVLGLAFVDFDRLVSVSEDETARLWNIADGTQLKQFDADSECNDVTVAPSGRIAAIASRGKVGIWDLESGETVHLLEHNLATVLSVAFSPDGATLATGTEQPPSLRFWNTKTGQEIPQPSNSDFLKLIEFAVLLEGKINSGVHDLAYSPDGQTLAIAQADSLLLVELASGRILKTLSDHFGGVYGVSFSSDGRRVASSSSDGAVRIWDVHHGRCLRTLPWHSGIVSNVVFCRSETWLASADESDVKVWNISPDWDSESREMHSDAAYCCAFDGQGKRLVSGGGRHAGVKVEPHLGEVRVLDVESGTQIFSVEFAATSSLPVLAVAISADGAKVAAAGRGGTLRIWNVDGQELVLQVEDMPGEVHSLTFHPGGELLLVAGLGGAIIIDASTGSRRHKFASAVYAVFSPSGETVYGCGRGFIAAWEVATEREVFRTRISPNAWRLAISPDEQFLALALDTRFVSNERKGEFLQLRDARSGKLIRTLTSQMHRDYADKDLVTSVYGVAFSPDGREIVTGSGDKTVRIWDAATGDELLVFPHSNQVFCVAFSPDGQRLASASGHWSGPRPGEVRVWNALLDPTPINSNDGSGGM